MRRRRTSGTGNGRSRSKMCMEGSINGSRILSLFYSSKGQLGVAYYTDATKEVFLAQGYDDESDFALVQLVKLQIRPSVILLPSTSSETLSAAVSFTDEDDTMTPGAPSAVAVTMLTPSLFSESVARRELMRVVKCPEGVPKDLYIASKLGERSYSTAWRASGALITFLRTNSIVPSSVSLTLLRGIVHIGEETVRGLQLANTYPKSILSLYSPSCTLGRAALQSWLLRPLRDADARDARMRSVESLCGRDDSEYGQEVAGMRNSLKELLKGLADPRQALESLRHSAGVAPKGAWTRLITLLETASKLVRLVKGLSSEVLDVCPVLGCLEGVWTDQCHYALRMLQKCVTVENGGVRVKEGVSPKLDQVVEHIKHLPDILNSTAVEILGRLGDHPHSVPLSLAVTYMPQIGYLVAMVQTDGLSEDMQEGEAQQQLIALGYPPELHFVFASGTHLYFKCTETEILDTEYGDLKRREADITEDILREVQTRLSQAETAGPISQLGCAMGELDGVLALVHAALHMGWTGRPEWTDSPGIHVEGGRHPLVNSSVPTNLSVGGPPTVVLCGPNASGKSHALRTVGCLTAQHLSIGPLDGIFSLLTGEDTTSSVQSAFSADTAQIGRTLSLCTSHSLLLLDEAGRGTHPLDGQALFLAMVRRLSAPPCPLSILSTNLVSALADSALTAVRHRVSVMHTEVEAESESIVAYKYTLAPGAISHTYAVAVARSAGFPQSLVDRALEICRAEREGGSKGAGGRNGRQASVLRVARAALAVDMDAPDALLKVSAAVAGL
ncbi:hypothetical protein KIPB_001609 [Kipferlia bialata]|uniref:DNA mismatch repair proteins mutS family domain-containing protein n=1 Tax=Kipferlia bialata TaxID=797122 RepID=A0A9K3GFM8_9EUKA|nr:hypothetical protein KIPB_001609 [Kipferlia bialata]|eukprot:g1609.t1